MSWLCLFNSFK